MRIEAPKATDIDTEAEVKEWLTFAAERDVFYVLFREHIRLRVRVQVSLLALLDKPTMAWLASAMSSQERLECGSTFRKRNMQHPSFSESELKLNSP